MERAVVPGTATGGAATTDGAAASHPAILAASQDPAGPSPSNPDTVWPHVLTRIVFGAGGEFLGADDRDMRLGIATGAAVDLVDYRATRVLFDFRLATILDDDWNPRHMDYGFDLAPSRRLGPAELALVYHHTSRHLHDRDRPEPIFFNRLGMTLAGTSDRAPVRLEGRAGGSVYFPGWQSYVDYRAEAVGSGRVRLDISPRWAYYADANLRVLRCDPEAGRGTLFGARVEGGLLLGYGAGRVEAFIGYDRRIDPTPLSREVVNLFVFGARLVTR